MDSLGEQRLAINRQRLPTNRRDGRAPRLTLRPPTHPHHGCPTLAARTAAAAAVAEADDGDDDDIADDEKHEITRKKS